MVKGTCEVTKRYPFGKNEWKVSVEKVNFIEVVRVLSNFTNF